MDPKDPVSIILARDAFKKAIRKKGYQRQEEATRAYRGINYGPALPTELSLASPGLPGSVTSTGDVVVSGGDYRGDRNKIAQMIQQASDERRQARESSTASAAAVTMTSRAGQPGPQNILARDVAGLVSQRTNSDAELSADANDALRLTTAAPTSDTRTRDNQKQDLESVGEELRDTLIRLQQLLIPSRAGGLSDQVEFTRAGLQDALTNMQGVARNMAEFPDVYTEQYRRAVRQIINAIQGKITTSNLTANPAIGAYGPDMMQHPQAQLLSAPVPETETETPPPSSSPGMLPAITSAVSSAAAPVASALSGIISLAGTTVASAAAAPFTLASAANAPPRGGPVTNRAQETSANTAGAVPVPSNLPALGTSARLRAGLGGTAQGSSNPSGRNIGLQPQAPVGTAAVPGDVMTRVMTQTERNIAAQDAQPTGSAPFGAQTLATAGARVVGAFAGLAGSVALESAARAAGNPGVDPGLVGRSAQGVLQRARQFGEVVSDRVARLKLQYDYEKDLREEWELPPMDAGARIAAASGLGNVETAQAIRARLQREMGEAWNRQMDEQEEDQTGNITIMQAALGGSRRRAVHKRKSKSGSGYYGFEPAYDFNTNNAAWRNQMPATALGAEPSTPPHSDVQPYTGLIGRPPGKVDKYKPSKAQLQAAKTARPTGIPIIDDAASDVEEQEEEARKSDAVDGPDNEVMAIARGKRPRETVGDAADKIRARYGRARLSEKRIKLLSSLRESLGRTID